MGISIEINRMKFNLLALEVLSHKMPFEFKLYFTSIFL